MQPGAVLLPLWHKPSDIRLGRFSFAGPYLGTIAQVRLSSDCLSVT